MTNYGIIGCGYFGAQMARTLLQFDNVAIKAVYSPGESSIRLSKELGCDRTSTVDELLTREDIDAVIIASPNNMHKEHVIKAANAKKHIFCEKPFALTIEDADEMIQAYRNNGVTLMVGHIMHYYHSVARAKELIDAGAIGEVMAAHVERTGWEDKQETVSWKKQQAISGGHLFHHIHEIDLLQWFMGPAAEVYTVADNLGHKGEGFGDEDDVILLTLKFKNDSFGTMQYGSGFRLGEHFIKINGTKGGILISFKDNKFIVNIDNDITEMPLFDSSESAESLNNTYGKKDGGISYGNPQTKPPAYITESITAELADFHAVVSGGEIPQNKRDLFDGSSARESVAIAYTALASKSSGVPEKVK